MANSGDPWRDYLDGGGLGEPFERQWERFRALSEARTPAAGPLPAWRPDPAGIAASNLGRFMAEEGFASYADLHAWTARERGAFWGKAIRRMGIRFAEEPDAVLDDSGGPEHPRWLPGASLNIAESCFSAEEEAPAVLSAGEEDREVRITTAGELRRMAQRAALGLRGLGLRPDDAVALYMPMTVECVAAYLGIVLAGLRAVSIADSFPPGELKRRLSLGQAKALVTAAGFLRAGKRVDLYGKVREAGAPRAVVVPDGEGSALRDGDLAWDALPAAGDGGFEAEAGDPRRVTNVLFSSGTTGDPKAIPWTHLTPIKGAMDGHFHHDIRSGDRVAWPTNIGWMMGPWLIYASLVNRAAMALYQGTPGGEGFARFVGDAGVTVLGVVPSLVRAWRASGAADGADWSRVRVFSSTGEPSNREDYLWLMSRAGYRAPVVEYCGGTEIGGGHITGTVVQPASPATFTTPALGLDFVLLGEDGSPAGEGRTGELYLVPPSVGLSQTLLNADHHEVYFAGCPRGPGGEVLRRHGDAVARLPGGFYRAQGRTDDTMNLGGIKVSSLEIERVVDAHPAVFQSAAVAAREGGEGADRLVLFVVPEGEGVADAEALRRDLGVRLAQELNPLFKVHRVVPIESLPRTASNKIVRRALRARFEEGGG